LPVSRAFFYIFLELFFVHLSKCSVNVHPFKFTLWIEIPESRTFTYPSRSLVKDPPLKVPLTELPYREMLHFQSPLYLSFKELPLIETPTCPPLGPLWIELPISRAFF
jgi:hypothetical protein